MFMYSAGRSSVFQETVSFWDINSSPIFFWKSMLYEISLNPEAGLLALEYSSSRLISWHSWWYCLSVQETQETRVRSLGQEDPLEEEMAMHSSILAWKIPWTEESGGLQSMGLQRVGHDWSNWAHMMIIYPERPMGISTDFRGLCVCVCVCVCVCARACVRTCVSEEELIPTANDACSTMTTFWDFPGSSVVKTLYFHCRGCGFNPWLEN